MIIRSYQVGDESVIQSIYQACFSGPFWNLNLTKESVAARWQDHCSREGFTCFVTEEGQKVVGASWFDMISRETLASECGSELADFTALIDPALSLIWIRETIVDPAFQGKRIASRLKNRIMHEIRSCHAPVILLTRMRDDNTKIVRINERLGFLRTGIRVASRAIPGLIHDYWYYVMES